MTAPPQAPAPKGRGDRLVEKGPEAFRTISEVAEEIDVPQHVLRFWESRFTQIHPMKRGGGRRFYRPEDVDLLRGVRHLLYGEGYTIRGVQRILREQGVSFVQNVWRPGAEPAPPQSDEDRAADEGAGPAPRERGPDLSFFTIAAQPGRDDDGAAGSEDAPERRHPQLVAAVNAAPPAKNAIGTEAKRKLAAALDDLIESRRLLEAALADHDPAGPTDQNRAP